eukprot:maker-scaffold277_size226016-snap-gene-0.26 protein:Tk10748 transcript:maker-scaffold277_size226016-snap-gene-0.26-mRNA-1 annotation:"tpa: cuticle protein"
MNISNTLSGMLISLCFLGLTLADNADPFRRGQLRRVGGRRSSVDNAEAVRPGLIRRLRLKEPRGGRQSVDRFADFGPEDGEPQGFGGFNEAPQRRPQVWRPHTLNTPVPTTTRPPASRFGFASGTNPLGVFGTLLRFLSYLVIEDVEELPQDVYKPASGPAYATATNIDELSAAPRFDDIQVSDGPIPAEQRELELAVFAGANSYKPEGVYQTEDRLEFQINGHKGPHSYRYGYDTGHGYNRQFRYEERDGSGFVKGRYGFFDTYGKLQVVNYEAHPEKGFHAEGAHVPHYPH